MSILQRNQPFLRQLAALVAQILGIGGQRATMPSAVNQSLSLHNDLGDLTRAEANAIIDRSYGDVVSPSVGLVVQLYVFVHFIYFDRYMLPSFRFISYKDDDQIPFWMRFGVTLDG